MSQDFSVLLHTPTDGTDGDCTASLKNPRGIEPRRILPQPRGSQAHTCMSPQSSDCLTFIHNLKPSDPSIFFRTPHPGFRACLYRIACRIAEESEKGKLGCSRYPWLGRSSVVCFIERPGIDHAFGQLLHQFHRYGIPYQLHPPCP